MMENKPAQSAASCGRPCGRHVQETSGRGVAGRALVLSMLALGPGAPLAGQLPTSALAVRAAGTTRVWWQSGRAPSVWAAALPEVAAAVRWRALGPGLEQGRLDLSGDGVGWRISVLLARADPARHRFSLETTSEGAAWTVDHAPAAAIAVNAGQFRDEAPWGWLVQDGRELQAPGVGPLSGALVVRRGSRLALLDADEIPATRSTGDVVAAFQSYPALLVGDGQVPEPLRTPGLGVDLRHRDTRVAVCLLRDGRLLLALTRFLSPDSPFARLPFGPTAPEMAAVMGALGCQRALLLDGGLSGQMRLRAGDEVVRWAGLRGVPVGLVAYPAPAPSR